MRKKKEEGERSREKEEKGRRKGNKKGEEGVGW